MRLSRIVVIGGLSVALPPSSTGALAGDGLLIWRPSKVSDTAFDARLGLQVPGWTFASAGIDLGVHTNGRGGPAELPMKLWGRVTASALQTPAYAIRRDIDLGLNIETGDASARMSYSNREILSRELDLELSRTVEMAYHGDSGDWSGVSLRQGVRLVNPATGTAFVVKTGALKDFQQWGGAVGIEQGFGTHLRVSAQLSDPAGADVSARIDARYSLTW